MKNRFQTIKYMLFILPALSLFTVFFLIPVLGSLFLSITDAYGLRQTYGIVGLENYIRAIKDSLFNNSIWTTVKYSVTHVALVNVLGLAVALLLDRKFLGRNILRTVVFIPQVMSLLIVGYLWTFMFTNVNITIENILGLSDKWHVSWLGNENLSIFSIGFASIWQGIGYYMVLYLSGLQGISEDYLEAAKIDGANSFDVLFRIKIPLLSPMILLCMILAISYAFKSFDLPYAMTSGGPNHSSETMVLRIYMEITKSWRYGYASALSVILFAIISMITISLNKIMRRLEEKV